MQGFLTLFGCALGAGISWWVVRSFEQTRFRSTIQALEAKLRYSLGESSQLKEQITHLQGETVSLRKTLDDERIDKTRAMAQLTESFKKGILMLGTGALCFGLILGGGTSWWTATVQADSKHRMVRTELEIDARLAGLKVDVLEKQIQDLRVTLDRLTNILADERAEKNVASAKLQILLESLSFNKGIEGFGVNYEKLRQNLQTPEPQTAPQDDRSWIWPVAPKP